MRDTEQLRTALVTARPLLGWWASIPTSLTAEVAAATGANYVVIDEQHGAVDASTMTAMLQAIAAGGAAPLVRVARNDPWVIGHALDLGALGVIVPMVDDAAQAARAVAACRYAPEGERSFGALRAIGSEPLCLTMVETRAGLENVEEIAARPAWTESTSARRTSRSASGCSRRCGSSTRRCWTRSSASARPATAPA